MDVEEVFDRLMDAGVSVWLDAEGKLRIDKDAPAELKQLIREHKQALIDVKKATALLNATGIRIVRLPLGQRALAYRPGTDLDQIRWAMKVLRLDSMPLVINDEGFRWVTWDQWKLRRQVWHPQTQDQAVSPCEAGKAPKLQFGRKTA